MANRDFKIAMADSGGTSLTAATKTDSFDTAWYSLSGVEYFGIVVDIGAVSGTSPTLDIDVEFSLDGGTTVFTEYPVSANAEAISGVSTNAAGLTQITTSDAQVAMYWQNMFPNDNNCKVRLECTVGGTGESIAIDNIYLVGRRFGKY
ncbi:MAG: hypothetical protein ACYSUD_13155 [Planctomycetota bacterium]|jgi:hypothetical protein